MANEPSRVAKQLAEIFEKNSVDAVLVHATDDFLAGNLKWLTNRPAYFGYARYALAHRSEDSERIDLSIVEHGQQGGTRVEDVGAIRREIHGVAAFRSVAYSVNDEFAVVLRVLRTRDTCTLGVPSSAYLPAGLVGLLREEGIEIVDLSEDFELVRATKCGEEISSLQATADMQDEVLSELLDWIRPGITEQEVIAFLKVATANRGAHQGVFLISSGPQGVGTPFRYPQDQTRVLLAGDVISVLIETDGENGMWTELGRTIVLGKAEPATLAAFDLARAAQANVVGQLKVGVEASAVSEADDEFSRANGVPPNRRVLGHGQGLDLMERPLIRADESMKLTDSMCLAIHPAYLLSEGFGYVCDNYHLTRGGVTRMHSTLSQIFEV